MIVHLVTDRSRLSEGGDWQAERRCLLDQAEQAIAAGVDVVQVRERSLEGRDLVGLVSAIVVLARGRSTRVVVNDRVDVALAANADGVHLRGDSIRPSDVRRIAPEAFLVGRSVHSVAEAIDAADADYLIAGTVWPSESKPGASAMLGVDGLAAIAEAVRIPVLAIGGVTLGRVIEAARAGAAGVAAIGLFLGPRESSCRAVPLRDVVETLRRRFDTPGSRS